MPSLEEKAAVACAWKKVKGDYVDFKNWENLTYHGRVDVTEHIPLASIADECRLTTRQYDQLIDRAQRAVDRYLRSKK